MMGRDARRSDVPRQGRPGRDAQGRRHHGRRRRRAGEDRRGRRRRPPSWRSSACPPTSAATAASRACRDPAMIKGIQEAVTIPVMAKARIGHFAEAQVLEALEVDYIDESEVLTPADEANHIDKWALQGPVRVRRDEPRRGAAAHRRGRGDDPLQGRGRHRRHRRGRAPPALDHAARSAACGTLDEMELATAAKELQAPLDLVRDVAARRQAAGRAVLRGRHRDARPTRRW